MPFILLHHENGLCGHQACLINAEQIASVQPIVGQNKIYALKSQATVRLTDGKELRVSEKMEVVMGMLRSNTGYGHVEGAGPQLVQFRQPAAMSAI